MFAKASIAIAIVVVALTSPCLAQAKSKAADHDNVSQEESACRRDTRRLCRHVKPDEGSGAFLNCLQTHRSALSKGCKNVLESHGL